MTQKIKEEKNVQEKKKAKSEKDYEQMLLEMLEKELNA